MNIYDISTISCKNRNKYEKDICTNLNPDKIETYLKPYTNSIIGNNSFFNKNTYYLDNKIDSINNTSKEECSDYCINNKFKGFTYKGDRNKCLIFNSKKLEENKDDSFNNYKINSYIKTKDIIDLKNFKEQKNSLNYFTEINNEGYKFNNLIDNIDIDNKKSCMNKCISNYSNCNSIIYLEEPKECIFYNDIIMKNNKLKKKFDNYDIYTVKKNKIIKNNEFINNLINDIDNNDNYHYCYINNDICETDINRNIDNSDNSDNYNNIDIPIYNCGGVYSTDPFCTKEYKPSNINKENGNYTECQNIEINNNNIEQQKIYNNICRKNFGDEYIFDNNIFDKNSIINCSDKDNIKIKCKLNFDNNIINEHFNNEHFNNEYFNNEHFNNLSGKLILLYFIFFIFFILIIYIFFIRK